jgi:hypothetical protein
MDSYSRFETIIPWKLQEFLDCRIHGKWITCNLVAIWYRTAHSKNEIVLQKIQILDSTY